MKEEVAVNPLAEFVGHRPKMYSLEAVKCNPDGTPDRFDKHRAKGIQRAAAERFLQQEYLDQLHKPTDNYSLNRRLGYRLQQIYGIEVSHPSSSDQNIECHHPVLSILAPVPTYHDVFLRMLLSVL